MDVQEQQRIFLTYRSIFRGQNAKARRSVVIQKFMTQHTSSTKSLIETVGWNKVLETLKILLEDRVFESEAQAKLRFPELFQTSSAQQQQQQNASEADAARSEAKALEAAAAEDTVEIKLENLDSGAASEIETTKENDHEKSSASLKLPSLYPIFFPYSTQHAILTKVQRLLEECCHEFSVHWLPELLTQRRWDCSEAIELNKWSFIMLKHMNNLPVGSLAPNARSSLARTLESVVKIRHAAVHRLFTSAKGILAMVASAIDLSAALQDQARNQLLRDFYVEVESRIKALELNKNYLQARLVQRLEEITKLRKELDLRERRIIEDTIREDREQILLAGDLLSDSVAVISNLEQTEESVELEKESDSGIGFDTADEDTELISFDCENARPEPDEKLWTAYELAKELQDLLGPLNGEDTNPEPDEELKPKPDDELNLEPDNELKLELDDELKPEPDDELKPEPDDELKSEPDDELKLESDKELESEPNEELKPEPDDELKPKPDDEMKAVNDLVTASDDKHQPLICEKERPKSVRKRSGSDGMKRDFTAEPNRFEFKLERSDFTFEFKQGQSGFKPDRSKFKPTAFDISPDECEALPEQPKLPLFEFKPDQFLKPKSPEVDHFEFKLEQTPQPQQLGFSSKGICPSGQQESPEDKPGSIRSDSLAEEPTANSQPHDHEGPEQSEEKSEETSMAEDDTLVESVGFDSKEVSPKEGQDQCNLVQKHEEPLQKERETTFVFYGASPSPVTKIDYNTAEHSPTKALDSSTPGDLSDSNSSQTSDLIDNRPQAMVSNHWRSIKFAALPHLRRSI